MDKSDLAALLIDAPAAEVDQIHRLLHEWSVGPEMCIRDSPYIHCFSGRTDSSNSTWFDKYHEINGTLNGRCFKRTSILLYGPTCNFAISRRVAEDFRFDDSFPDAACEDIDFCFRLMQQGFRTIHRCSMVVRHDYQYEPVSYTHLPDVTRSSPATKI